MPPASRAPTRFRAVWEQLDSQALIRHQQANAQLHGWAASEITWSYNPDTGRVDPVHLHHARCRDFYVATLYQPRVTGALPDELLVRATDLDFIGQRLIPGKWVITRRTHRVPLAKAGLGRGSAMLALLKALGIADWMIWIHRFGLPFPVITVNNWADLNERAQAMAIIESIGQDGGAIKDGNAIKAIEFLDGIQMSRNTSSDVHQRLAQFVDLQLAKIWAGAALVTESGEGAHSYAQASAQMPRFDSRVLADTQRMERAIREQLIIPWWQVNNLPGVPARLKFHLVQPGDPREAAEVAAIMRNDLGIELSAAQMYEVTGYRSPSSPQDAVPGRVAPTGTEAFNAD